MATNSRTFLVYVDGQRKVFDSARSSALFNKLGFTNNGVDQGIEIASDGTGFDFGSKLISNLSMNGVSLENSTVSTAKLADWNVGTAASNDLLRYDSASAKWVPLAADDETLVVGALGPTTNHEWGDSVLFTGPIAIVVNSTGIVFVANSDGTIVRVALSGAATLFATTTNNVAHGMAIDHSDNLFVTDATNHLIYKITPAGSVSTFSAALTLLTGPICVDSTNKLYVANSNFTISKVTTLGVVTLFATLTGTIDSLVTDSLDEVAAIQVNGSVISFWLIEPNGDISSLPLDFLTEGLTPARYVLCVDSSDTVYVHVTSGGKHYVARQLTPISLEMTIFARGFANVHGCYAQDSAYLYTIDSGTGKIARTTFLAQSLKIADEGISATQLAESAATVNKLSPTGLVTAGEAISAGSAVYYEPANGKVYKAQADYTDLAWKKVGIATQNMSNGATGYVNFEGGALPTSVSGYYAGLTAGLPVYVAESLGGVTQTAPTDPGHVVYQVGIATASDTILVLPEFIYTNV